MLYTNAMIFRGTEGFVRGSLLVSDGRIREVIREDADPVVASGSCQTIRKSADMPFRKASKNTACSEHRCPATDLQGCHVIPGLVDIHIHGSAGYDFSDGNPEELQAMGRYLAAHGITSFAPTSMTLPEEQLKAAFMTARAYHRSRPQDGAKLLGIHMEGPYLSEKKAGAQNRRFLRKPDMAEFCRLQEAAGGLIRIVDIAPELEGAQAFIREISRSCRISAAHTDGSYEEAREAFTAGVTHVTHLFNAMPALHHRSPGLIGAAFEQKDVTAELICDGLHVHPTVARMAFQLFRGRICLVSDALRCCGMPDGDYELGGQRVSLRNGEARLPDGHLAGAAKNLFDDMVNAIRWGIPAEEAVLAATLTPAAAVGADAETGSLEAGKKADFLVCDRDWNLKEVYIEGRKLRRRSE